MPWGLYLFLLVVAVVVWGYNRYHLKKEAKYACGRAIIAVIFVVIICITLLLYSGYQLSEKDINAITFNSIILALGALAIALSPEMKNVNIFTNLNSKIDTLSENLPQIDLNTQQIITQIKQLEESQKALADQIQSLKDSLTTAEPSEEPHDDEDQAKG